MTDKEMQASVRVDMTGNLQSQAERNERALKNTSQNGARHLAKLRSSAASLDQTIGRLGNRWTAMATGGGLVLAGRNVIKLQEQFEYLGVASNQTREKVESLRGEIYKTANLPHIRVDASKLTESIEEVIEKTGDLKFAQDNLENFGMALSATGAEGKAIGGIAAEFKKMGIIDPKDVREAMDILVEQGKAGAFTLKELAALGPRVFSAYAATGRTGVNAVREMGAALQSIRMGTGSSEQAATAFENLILVMQKAEKIKGIKRLGVTLYDPEMAKQGKEVLRPINELYEEIIKAADGRGTLLNEIIGDQTAMTALNAGIAEFNMTGEIASLDGFFKVVADGSGFMNDSARIAGTAAGALRAISNQAERFADINLGGPIQSLADALKDLDDKDMERIFDNLLDAGVGLLTMFAGAKVMRGGLWAVDKFSKGKGGAAGGAANALTGAASSMGAPIPVFVVNGMGGLSDASGPVGNQNKKGKRGGKGKGKAAKAATPKTSVMSKVGAGARMAGVGVGWLAAGAGGLTALVSAYQVGSAIGDSINTLIEGSSTHDAIGEYIAKAMSLVSDDAAQAVKATEAYRLQVEVGLNSDASKLINMKTKNDADNKDVDVAINGSFGPSMRLY
jgi:hypothetical protein